MIVPTVVEFYHALFIAFYASRGVENVCRTRRDS